MPKKDLKKLLTPEEYERLKKVDANMFNTNPPSDHGRKERRVKKNVKE